MDPTVVACRYGQRQVDLKRVHNTNHDKVTRENEHCNASSHFLREGPHGERMCVYLSGVETEIKSMEMLSLLLSG